MAKKILLTGATDGIGKQTAMELFKQGHELIIHGRNADKTEATKEEILSGFKKGKVHTAVADFSALRNIEKLSEDLHDRFDRIDVLINNAGIYMNGFRESADGFEMTFAVNHLATFALTLRMLDLIKSPGGRIVTVASMAHASSPPLNLEDVNNESTFDPYTAYAHSKLCNILFAKELAVKLRERGITSNSLHPGVIDTKLLRAGFGGGGSSVEKGAETPIYLAVSGEVENISGKYFINKQLSEPSVEAKDKQAQQELWKYSEKHTGLQ